MSDNVLISLITGVCGVVMAFITVSYKRQRAKPKAKDRIDLAFDMYEATIKRQDAEIERKDEQINKLNLELSELKRR